MACSCNTAVRTTSLNRLHRGDLTLKQLMQILAETHDVEVALIKEYKADIKAAVVATASGDAESPVKPDRTAAAAQPGKPKQSKVRCESSEYMKPSNTVLCCLGCCSGTISGRKTRASSETYGQRCCHRPVGLPWA